MQRPPDIWVFFGMIATGKSTLAEAWAKRHHLAHYNSDRLRKELAGLPPTTREVEAPGQGIYSRDFTLRTYNELLDRARNEIAAGNSVILDASYQQKSERDRVRMLAADHGTRICFVYCICPEDVVKERLVKRSRDQEAVSDGRWEIYQAQKERFATPDELPDDILIKIYTDQPIDALLDHLEAMSVGLGKAPGRMDSAG
ncbi:MAG: AAA family ATPase [Proteobacteria bacterium]|nr:AAA family ATPase [Pseudomonadota bacterium]MBU1737559.1 AAA family ATPase [Pseudomonadota bacterium]